ncbi:ABC transporter ATP-binding protein [Microbacterium invictum]|uniref:ABC transporter ATP-binding protein n=1 Tax=Microbacterium invictum TaxID=515415 RepID=A0ABZ0V9J4_9MICO|nr:ABC transporter ATP-binding protein [Microbacterium invictum]WQB69482.1 ABC transporter ATP-binding protein [Microbacterium invictum]
MTSTMAQPEVVRIEHVSKSFVVRTDNTIKDRVLSYFKARRHRKVHTATDDLSLSIQAGTTVGLLGANGSGKSTLLKLIGGILSPDTGEVLVRGRVAALLELGAGFHPELSGRENVYLNASLLGLSRQETEARFNEIVAFSGIGEFIETEVKFYSSGMYMRLAFAVAVHTDPDILLVDEVLAVGDEAFQRKCMDKIRTFQREGRTIIIVSHASSQIAELCDETYVLDRGKVAFHGNAQGGLSALRDILEHGRVGASAAIAEEESEEEEENAEASRVLRVSSVSAIGRDGGSTDHFTQGAQLTLRIRVTATERVDDWTVGFGIDTPNGQFVLGTSSDRLQQDLTPLEAGDSRDVDFSIRSLHLGVGEYYVNARATDLGRSDSDISWQAAMIHIDGSERSVGTVAADVEFATNG